MIDVHKAFYERMTGSSELLDKLGSNRPFYDKAAASAKVNSIYPAGQAPMNANTPFITVQGGVVNKYGKKMFEDFRYIRVYDKMQKSYVTIGEIAQILKDLFDEEILPLDNDVSVRTQLDSILQEATDEAMSLNFREIRFRTVLIS